MARREASVNKYSATLIEQARDLGAVKVLRQSVAGTLRIGKSRVPLERVIEAYDQGQLPETICSQYPSLSLADVYAVLSIYLSHRELVKKYLRAQEAGARTVRESVRKYAPEDEVIRRLRRRAAG